MVSDENVTARSVLAPQDFANMGSEAGGSLLRTISSAKQPFLAGSTASPTGKSAKQGGAVIEKRAARLIWCFEAIF